MIVRDAFHVEDVGNREVGIEIEMEGEGFNVLLMGEASPNYWRVTEDGSLRGESAELVLKRPCERNRVKSRLDYLQKYLADIGIELNPSDRCGVHVHINCQPLTIKELFKYITLYLIFEDLLVNWCGDDRVGNLFCLRTRDASGMLEALIKAKQDGHLMDLMYDAYRYSAMNVTALGEYGSLEFRAMRTPANFDRINVWVETLLSIKDYALSARDDRAFVEQLSVHGGDNFARSVLGSRFDDFKCDELDDMMLEGVRAAQHLAYTPLKELPDLEIPPPKRRAVRVLPRPVRGLGVGVPENPPVVNRDVDVGPAAR